MLNRKTNVVGLVTHLSLKFYHRKFKRGRKEIQRGYFKVRTNVLEYVGADSILFDQAVPEIFFFKHDVGSSQTIICIGNPNVDNISNAILVLITLQLG